MGCLKLPSRNKTECTEFVKQQFSLRGFITPDDWLYQDSARHIPFTCSEGHQHRISWANFSSGKGCGKCTGRYSVTTETVRESFEAEGWRIADPDWVYKNAREKIPFVCDQGHEHKIPWYVFKEGHRCGKCTNLYNVTTETVRESFEAEGWHISDPQWEYVNCYGYIPFVCDQGHEHKISWLNFQKGHRCGFCFGMYPTEEEKAIKKIQENLWKNELNSLKAGFSKIELLQWDEAYPLAQALYKRYNRPPSPSEHIDHLVPRSFFDPSNKAETLACNNPANLRYLEASKNISRGNRLTKAEMEEFTEEQIQILVLASRRPPKYDRWIKELASNRPCVLTS